jgi:hypothetical protein
MCIQVDETGQHSLGRARDGDIICIPVDIDSRVSTKQLIIRFPLPYRIRENSHPGNRDEKSAMKLGHIHGSKRTVQMSLFHDCMDLAFLTVKPYVLSWDIF